MSDIDRERAIELIELMMREYEENECMVCDITFGDEELEALRFARDSLKADEAYQLEYEQPKFCENCISRKEVLNAIKDGIENGEYTLDGALIMAKIADLPSVLPKADKPIIYCRDCKWWKDSDGTYSRGISAESKCLMNTKVIYEGNGYCYLAEPADQI